MGIKDTIQDITAILLEETPIVSVYVGVEKIWPLINPDNPVDILSCFGSGQWLDSYPWTDDLAWVD